MDDNSTISFDTEQSLCSGLHRAPYSLHADHSFADYQSDKGFEQDTEFSEITASSPSAVFSNGQPIYSSTSTSLQRQTTLGQPSQSARDYFYGNDTTAQSLTQPGRIEDYIEDQQAQNVHYRALDNQTFHPQPISTLDTVQEVPWDTNRVDLDLDNEDTSDPLSEPTLVSNIGVGAQDYSAYLNSQLTPQVPFWSSFESDATNRSINSSLRPVWPDDMLWTQYIHVDSVTEHSHSSTLTPRPQHPYAGSSQIVNSVATNHARAYGHVPEDALLSGNSVPEVNSEAKSSKNLTIVKTQKTTLKSKPTRNASRRPCDRCIKTFQYPKDLLRHQKSVHSSIRYPCLLSDDCHKPGFTRGDNLVRHMVDQHDWFEPFAKHEVTKLCEQLDIGCPYSSPAFPQLSNQGRAPLSLPGTGSFGFR